MSSTDLRKNVVVVGGGAAGAATARALSAKLNANKYSLILINARPYSVFLPATARIAVSAADHLEDTAFIPYDKVFHEGKGKFVVGKVVAVHSDGKAAGGRVVLESGEEIVYEILVLSPGSVWEGPLAFPNDPEEVTAFIANGRKAIENAKHVALVGGGAVGIEIAGEIKDIWPTKKVTIIQGDSHLLNKTYPAKFRATLETRIRKRGVDILFNEYVDDIPEPHAGSVKTRSGKTVDADLVLQTRGAHPNTSFLTSLGDVLTESGHVKVRRTLQLAAHDNIYAGGDILDIKEEKQAAKAGNHAAIIAANILAAVEGRPLVDYKGSKELIVITIGRGGGAGYFDVLWGIVIGDFLTRLIKSKSLLVSIGRSGLGYA